MGKLADTTSQRRGSWAPFELQTIHATQAAGASRELINDALAIRSAFDQPSRLAEAFRFFPSRPQGFRGWREIRAHPWVTGLRQPTPRPFLVQQVQLLEPDRTRMAHPG